MGASSQNPAAPGAGTAAAKANANADGQVAAKPSCTSRKIVRQAELELEVAQPGTMI